MELNYIHTGNAKELCEEIPNESVDLIFCDPIYENVEDYEWLGELANRVLKPNSVCLAWTSVRMLAKCQEALEKNLKFNWTLFYAEFGRNTTLHLYGVMPKTTPLLYFTKGRRKATPYIPDLVVSTASADFSKTHEFYFDWQKNEASILRYLLSFSKPNDTVLDPFAGSGTVPTVCKKNKRNFLACEIQPLLAEKARKRVEITPIPLFYHEPEFEQVEMALEA